jgi:hypothetical protein
MISAYQTPDYVKALHAIYAELADRPANLLSVDERRGLDYYFADIGQTTDVSATVANWTEFVHQLDEFVLSMGRMPRSDSTRPRPRTAEQELVDRLGYQRRLSVRAAHCTYQTDRLELVPGFRWDPHQQRWEEQFEEHQRFWTQHRRAPRRDAPDPRERALGRWVAHQRATRRDGSLPAHRARRLRDARYRVL